MTGPRQMTGSFSSSRIRLVDIISMPPSETPGMMLTPSLMALSWTPNIFGTEGPVTSASRMPTVFPLRFAAIARRPVTSDLPTPPLPLTTPMTFFTFDSAFIGSEKSFGSCTFSGCFCFGGLMSPAFFV